ncbi:MAG: cell division protein ZapB [Treponema sp.]|nr:cell division protein ZapB [Treponema sp.]
MISVDTIRLLQQKVESAVQKIEQLKAENDALRAERSELTKALSEKSELLSRFSADEKKIEDGILGALNRLDAVENAVLDSSGGFNKVEADCNTSREHQAPLGDSANSAGQAAQQTTAPQTQVQAAPAAPQEPVQSEPAPAPANEAPAQAEPVTQASAIAQTSEDKSAEQELVADLFDDSFETQEESVPDIF